MIKTYLTLGLILISILLLTVTPTFANDCDPTVDYNALGHTQYEQGEYTSAIASFTCAVQADPEAAKVYNARGNAYRGLSDYVSAIADYDKAVEIDDEYAIAYNNRGWAYFKLDDEEQALENYNKALELDPNLAYAYNNRGLIFQLNGKEELAAADFNRAIDLNLPVSWAEYNLDLIQSEVVETSPASEVNTETATTDTEAEAVVRQALAARDKRNWAKAIELFTKALEIDPDHFSAHYYRGRSYIALDQFEEAFADFTWLVETRPRYAYGYWERAIVAAQLGNFEQANADAATAYQLDPECRNNFYAFGTIAALSGNPVEAGKQFSQILDTYDTEPLVYDPVELGTTITLRISEQTIYAIPFVGEAGQTLDIKAHSTQADPLIVLLDTDGNPINGDDDSGPGYSAHIRDAQLPEDGTYTLLVGHGGCGSNGGITVTITLAE